MRSPYLFFGAGGLFHLCGKGESCVVLSFSFYFCLRGIERRVSYGIAGVSVGGVVCVSIIIIK